MSRNLLLRFLRPGRASKDVLDLDGRPRRSSENNFSSNVKEVIYAARVTFMSEKTFQ